MCCHCPSREEWIDDLTHLLQVFGIITPPSCSVFGNAVMVALLYVRLRSQKMRGAKIIQSWFSLISPVTNY